MYTFIYLRYTFIRTSFFSLIRLNFIFVNTRFCNLNNMYYPNTLNLKKTKKAQRVNLKHDFEYIQKDSMLFIPEKNSVQNTNVH